MKRKLVLQQNESNIEFEEKFKNMFGLTFSDWKEKAKVNAGEEMIEWYDEKISAGCTAYDGRIKVYA